jgi:hypothetical protein
VLAAMPRVAAIVLSWNSFADTRSCLLALHALDYPALAIRVVDNGSADGSAAALRREFPGIALHANPTNLGYTGGNNLGIRAALADGAQYLWLFNNDATAAPDVLARLVAVAEADPAIGLASPLIARAAPGLGHDFAGGLIDTAAGSYCTTEAPEQGRAWQAAHPERFMLTGTALLVRRALVERIGVLDDRFFAYWEDTDYALRALRAGFRNHLAFDIAVGHAAKPPAASGLGRPHFYYFMARNEILFWRKHFSARAAGRPLLWAVRRQLRLAAATRATPATAEAIMAGLWDGLRGRGGGYDPARRMPAAARRLLALVPTA